MMEIDSFKIKLQKDNCHPGDTLEGEISFNITDSDFKFTEICVKLRGKAEVDFSK